VVLRSEGIAHDPAPHGKVKAPQLRLAAQLDGGLLWGRVVVALAFKAVDRVWVWGAPPIRVGGATRLARPSAISPESG
jgi:hypothetical protein